MSVYESKYFYLWYAAILLCVNIAIAWGLQKIGGTPIPNLFWGFGCFSYGIYNYIDQNY